jgi:two-component system response regulator DevR
MSTTSQTAPVRVLLVDAQEIYRRGIVRALAGDLAVDVVGQTGTVAQADQLVGSLRPDVVLLDSRLPDGSGVDLCRRSQQTAPSTHWLFLTADGDGLADAASAGAAGHLRKDVHPPELVRALVRAAAGGTWDAARDGVAATAVSELTLLVASLTEREAAVLRLITDGLTNRQIGAVLFLSEKTVKNYVSGVLAKLGVQRRTQAAVLGADARELLGAPR